MKLDFCIFFETTMRIVFWIGNFIPWFRVVKSSTFFFYGNCFFLSWSFSQSFRS